MVMLSLTWFTWPMKKVTQTLNVNMAQVYLAKSRLARLLKAELKRLEDKIN